MFLLLSNDDGYASAGMRALVEVMEGAVERLIVMAPESNCSGVSHALTLTRPLTVQTHGNAIYSVNGTPADCVRVAVGGYFDEVPDMVISGINCGANLGDDVLYSGTVAAAFEGRYLKFPALAISNVAHRPKHLADTAQIVLDLFSFFKKNPLTGTTLLNINIPDLPRAEIRGIRVTRLGQCRQERPLEKMINPRQEECYWIGANKGGFLADEGSDFAAIEQGFVSITPLQFDVTHDDQLEAVKHWLEPMR